MSTDIFRERLRIALMSRIPKRLDGGTRAAVLIPLFEQAGEVRVWLGRRPETMRKHKGQVAFPGGKFEEGDANSRATALREAEEEFGIDPSAVDVLGELDDYATITDYTVSPIVGWLAPGVNVSANSEEVARAFAAPLSSFLLPEEGVFPFRGWRVEGEFVWGVTAAIVRNLAVVLREIGERV